MILGVPSSEIAWLALAVVIAGVITGLLAGMFGIGGGAVIVPVLYEVFQLLAVPDAVRMQLCVGTSIAIIMPTTIRSFLTHRQRGLVIPRVIRLWALPAVLGVTCGAVIAAFAPSAVFKIAFILIAGFIAIKFLFAGDRWNLGKDLPGPLPMTAYGFGIGLAGSLMGVSGGSLSNMVLTLYGKPIHNAVATSAGLGVPITIVGTLGYTLAGLPHEALLPPLSLGFVSLIGVAVMAPVSSFTAPYGARLAHRLSRRTMEIAFSCFLLVVSSRFLVSLIFNF
ncbi:MAG: sulfite exporter TauE/SafE family protein [Xanthobacteraceae bacterium]